MHIGTDCYPTAMNALEQKIVRTKRFPAFTRAIQKMSNEKGLKNKEITRSSKHGGM
jgi:hypothetical protein